jgi:acyl carrier protein phosphodiesterase
VRVNYLAHLYLAGRDDDWIAGALLGDFVKGRLENLPLSPGLVDGIRLHRTVDSFTDSHPLVRRSRIRLNERRRVSGIIVDLAYDHFLAVRWHEFTDEPLPLFCNHRYDRLVRHMHGFPPELRAMLRHMVANDWLGSYAELENTARALERIGTRLRQPGLLTGVLADLEQHYAGLEQDFLEFFPQLTSHVARFEPDALALPQTTPKSASKEVGMTNTPPARPQTPERRLMPGDQAPPGTPGTGENICRDCQGSGRLQGRDCPACGGTGRVVEGIGGA